MMRFIFVEDCVFRQCGLTTVFCSECLFDALGFVFMGIGVLFE